MFGRHVEGPLSLVKSTWLSDQPNLDEAKPNVVKFILDLREKLGICQELAFDNAKYGQTKSKLWYDRNARERSFEIGQWVLVLLPIPGKPILAKYQGPFRVIVKRGPVDYIIATLNRRRTQRVCHVNMLKEYVERDWKVMYLNTTVDPSTILLNNENDHDFGPDTSTQHDTFSLIHFPGRDREQLQSLLNQNPHIFNDNPGKTHLCTHTIELKPGTRPIRLTPYRVHPEKSVHIRKEFDLMIKMGVIEESNSPWASPVVLIPKPDGSIRFCVDYRRLNDVTIADAYPLSLVEDHTLAR